jgi:hypothetical protein
LPIASRQGEYRRERGRAAAGLASSAAFKSPMC